MHTVNKYEDKVVRYWNIALRRLFESGAKLAVLIQASEKLLRLLNKWEPEYRFTHKLSVIVYL